MASEQYQWCIAYLTRHPAVIRFHQRLERRDKPRLDDADRKADMALQVAYARRFGGLTTDSMKIIRRAIRERLAK